MYLATQYHKNKMKIEEERDRALGRRAKGGKEGEGWVLVYTLGKLATYLAQKGKPVRGLLVLIIIQAW